MRFNKFRICIIVLLLFLSLTSLGVTTKKYYLVRSDYNFAPYEFLDEKGNQTGFNVEIVQAVAKVMGLNIEISLGPWNEVRSQLENGQIDGIAGMFYSKEREKVVDFSTPHSIVTEAIFIRKNSNIKTINDIKGKEIIVQKGDIMHDYAIKNKLSDKIIAVESPIDALRLLSSGKHDCALLAKLQSLYFVKKYELTNIITGDTIPVEMEYCFAAKKGETELLSKFNEGLKLIKINGQYKQIYDKWFGIIESEMTQQKILETILWIMIPTLIVIALIVLWSWSLKTQVNKKTKELKEELQKRQIIEKELILAKDQAELANNSKNMFLANMSHELRTPLNGIVGLIEILSLTGLSEEQKTYIRDIENCSNNLLVIINDILDISKIEAGKIEIETRKFELDRLIESISNSFAIDFYKKNLEFIYYIEPNISNNIEADDGKIRQILSNLISNAKKFTDSGSIYLNISRHFKGDKQIQLQFSVEDTGIGISQTIRDKLFVPFEQGDITYSKKYQGTGLGLSISKKLVESMGGQIWFETAEGKGSKFFFTVDIKELPRDNKIKENIYNIPKDIKILVIDDNELNREITKKMLEEYKIDVELAKNGFEGIELIKNNNYNLLLLDVSMPDMDGLEVAEKLKNTGNKIPIVLFSSVDISDKTNILKELDIKNYIIKPIKKGDLLNKIIEILHEMPAKKEVYIPHEVVDIGSNIRILLVEDNEQNSKNMTFFLKRAGYEVISAINGKEAVECYEKYSPDLILMDLQLPVMSGIDATKIIRDKEAGQSKKTPIIALTAYARKVDEEKCFEAGMDDFIAKPVKFETIIEKIKYYLQCQ